MLQHEASALIFDPHISQLDSLGRHHWSDDSLFLAFSEGFNETLLVFWHQTLSNQTVRLEAIKSEVWSGWRLFAVIFTSSLVCVSSTFSLSRLVHYTDNKSAVQFIIKLTLTVGNMGTFGCGEKLWEKAATSPDNSTMSPEPTAQKHLYPFFSRLDDAVKHCVTKVWNVIITKIP